MRKQRTVRHRLQLGLGAAGVALVLIAAPMGMVAFAAPSEQDINNARQEERLAEMSVAQLEVQLAQVRSSAANALVAAQTAAEALNQAQVDLDRATAAADKAEQEAQEAQTRFEEGQAQLASVAQTAFRSGSGSLDSLAPYLTADGLENIETRQNVIDSFGTAADTQMQKVAALKKVAQIMSQAAEKAKAAQQDAVAEVEQQSQTAQAASQAATEAAQNTEVQYEAVLAELAQKRNTTVELERQRQEDQDRRREAAEREATIAAGQQNQGGTSSGSSGSGSSRPSSGGSSSGGSSSGSSSSGSSGSSGSSSGNSGGTWTPPPPSGSGVQGAIAFAKSVLGAPYVWAGEGPGYDCSGLVTVSYRQVGVNLTHQSISQWNETAKVPVGSAEPGDLIFWSSNGTSSGIYHVAIYLGDNQIIEAPTFGVPIRITSIYGWGSVMPQAGRVIF